MKNFYLLPLFIFVISCGKKTTPEPVKPTPPGAVTGVNVTKTTPTTITLEWPAVPNADGYRVYRSDLGTTTFRVEVPLLEDTQLKNNTSYTYQIAAFNKDGEGPKSNSITAKTTSPPIPTLSSVVDDPKWVGFLAGKWGFYRDGDGYKYSNYVLTFNANSIIMDYRRSYNDYITLIDPESVELKYTIKIEKNILYTLESGVYKKYARIELVSDDEMKIYRIFETQSSYSESLPELYTKVNSVEKPKDAVIEVTALKTSLNGMWSYPNTIYTNSIFDFTGDKNFYFDNYEFQGAKSSYKYEFKINSESIISLRKWDNDFDPAWVRYKIVMESTGIMKWYKINASGKPETSPYYTLTKK